MYNNAILAKRHQLRSSNREECGSLNIAIHPFQVKSFIFPPKKKIGKKVVMADLSLPPTVSMALIPFITSLAETVVNLMDSALITRWQVFSKLYSIIWPMLTPHNQKLFTSNQNSHLMGTILLHNGLYFSLFSLGGKLLKYLLVNIPPCKSGRFWLAIYAKHAKKDLWLTNYINNKKKEKNCKT